jgi:hypothetical protein
MRLDAIIAGHEVIGDGQTVWVNSGNGAVGRFGRTRVDVHSPDNTACEDCGPVGDDKVAAWERFKLGMRTHHKVDVPERFRPTWVQKRGPTGSFSPRHS